MTSFLKEASFRKAIRPISRKIDQSIRHPISIRGFAVGLKAATSGSDGKSVSRHTTSFDLTGTKQFSDIISATSLLRLHDGRYDACRMAIRQPA
jgi:hypothetical protein